LLCQAGEREQEQAANTERETQHENLNGRVRPWV
jgi:hypothetical protein